MKLIRPPSGSDRQHTACVVTVGSFDGLHIGHQALLTRCLELARELQLPAAMLSFEPLPREFLRPHEPPARLTNLRERWRLLARTGLDRLYLLRFNAALRQRSGGEFMQLLARLGAQRVIIGHDFRFGRNDEADADWCRSRGPAHGFQAEVVAPVKIKGVRVGSSSIRDALATGDLQRARELLGRPYTMRARVHRGQQLGRQIGFPTINLPVHRRRVPLSGIFAVRVSAGAPGSALQGWPAVASLGTRPTVNGIEPLLEAHLFDFDGDLYGLEMEVEFVARLRDEEKFSSLDLMIGQMRRDAAEARRLLMD